MHPQMVQQVVPLAEHELTALIVALQDDACPFGAIIAALVEAEAVRVRDLICLHTNLLSNINLTAGHCPNPNITRHHRS